MSSDLTPLPSDRRVRDLLALYESAQRELAAQIRAAVNSGDLVIVARRRRQLAAAQDVLRRLGVAADPIAREAVMQATLDGSAQARAGIAKIGVHLDPAADMTFAGVNAEAVATMQDSLLQALDSARQTVGRKVADVYAREARQQATRALLGAEGSPRAATRRLARRLAEQGSTGFVDRAGRRWGLDRYAEMAVRTVTREAVVQGSIARMAVHGVDLARVSRHASSCTVCQPYEGRLVDLGGDTREYEGEAVMDASVIPPFHPNCRHTLQPFAVRIDQVRRQLAAQGGA